MEQEDKNPTKEKKTDQWSDGPHYNNDGSDGAFATREEGETIKIDDPEKNRLAKSIEIASEATKGVAVKISKQIEPPINLEDIETRPIREQIAVLLVLRVKDLQDHNQIESHIKRLLGTSEVESLQWEDSEGNSLQWGGINLESEAILEYCLQDKSYAFFILESCFLDFLKGIAQAEDLKIESFREKYVEPGEMELINKHKKQSKTQIDRYGEPADRKD